jgi:hypothetical protein
MLCTGDGFAVEALRRVKLHVILHIKRESRLCQLESELRTVTVVYSVATPSSASLLCEMDSPSTRPQRTKASYLMQQIVRPHKASD